MDGTVRPSVKLIIPLTYPYNYELWTAVSLVLTGRNRDCTLGEGRKESLAD